MELSSLSVVLALVCVALLSSISPALTQAGSAFECQPLSDTDGSPASVHQLRPTDVRVIGAMGNSLTAGFGVLLDAAEIYVNRTDFRGLSWSIGGDLTLANVTTLPNILRQYSPDLYGYSTGETPTDDFLDLPNTRLNVALSGAYTSEILAQAQDLVRKMQESDEIDFQNDWKVVTIFIGINDACLFCVDGTTGNPEIWTQNIAEGLDYLRDNSPRTFVNLVQVGQLGDFQRAVVTNSVLGNTVCRLFYSFLCPCGPFGSASIGEDEFDELFDDFQQNITDLINSRRYDQSEDFTVVLQPFLSSVQFNEVNGDTDISFLASDCFHFNLVGNGILAVGLWNNMLERVGQKTSESLAVVTDIRCPTDDDPFFFTNENSSSIQSSSPLNSVLLFTLAMMLQLMVQ